MTVLEPAQRLTVLADESDVWQHRRLYAEIVRPASS